jgi:hypothetical protein
MPVDDPAPITVDLVGLVEGGGGDGFVDRDTIFAMYRQGTGVASTTLGAGFFVAEDGAASVLVTPGLAVIRDDADVVVVAEQTDDVDIYADFAAPDATDPRIDLVVIQITDAAANEWELAVVEGTPDPTPDEPDIPLDAFPLAFVEIPANESDATNWTFTDVRLLIGTDWQGGTVTGTAAFRGDFSVLTQPSVTPSAYVFNVSPQGDTDEDFVQFFDVAPGLQRQNVPTIDASGETAVVQQIAQVLFALGLATDGS